jgi:hypothetical protein
VNKLLGLRTAVEKGGGTLVKEAEATFHDALFDSSRLSLLFCQW